DDTKRSPHAGSRPPPAVCGEGTSAESPIGRTTDGIRLGRQHGWVDGPMTPRRRAFSLEPARLGGETEGTDMAGNGSGGTRLLHVIGTPRGLASNTARGSSRPLEGRRGEYDA